MKREVLLKIIGLIMLCNSNAFAWSEVIKTMKDGLNSGLYPGASLYVGDEQKQLFQYSVGDSHEDKIYDIASLTKVVVTTTLVMLMEERGKLSLTDEVAKYFPDFQAKVTIEDLLRHKAGLPAGARPEENEKLDAYIVRITKAKLHYVPGTRTVYSDLSFILLGRVVEIVSKKTLEQLAQEEIFLPLKMVRSTFQVSAANMSYCAPTADTRKCQVHDPTAFSLLPHQVGNAGLFSTQRDLSIFVRMILNLGEVSGVRILKSATVKKMLMSDGLRGLGWDYLSEFSTSPRGDVFPTGISFGHSGYTGTTIWIDPRSKVYYVFLSNRVAMGDEQTKLPFSKHRKKLSTEIGKIVINEMFLYRP